MHINDSNEKAKAKISYVHDKGLFYSQIASLFRRLLLLEHLPQSKLSMVLLPFLFVEFWHRGQKKLNFFFW
jgi:hypothetical protein